MADQPPKNPTTLTFALNPVDVKPSGSVNYSVIVLNRNNIQQPQGVPAKPKSAYSDDWGPFIIDDFF